MLLSKEERDGIENADKSKYTVFATQGQGGGPECDFDTLEEALQYVGDHKGEASFGILYPNGTWHKWERGNSVNVTDVALAELAAARCEIEKLKRRVSNQRSTIARMHKKMEYDQYKVDLMNQRRELRRLNEKIKELEDCRHG